jgi:hypothetical protein
LPLTPSTECFLGQPGNPTFLSKVEAAITLLYYSNTPDHIILKIKIYSISSEIDERYFSKIQHIHSKLGDTTMV